MARASRAQAERPEPLGDDYLIAGEGEFGRPSATARVARVLQAILLIFLAVLSLALFWVAGLMCGIF